MPCPYDMRKISDLKSKTQRHLNLSRASDCFRYLAQSTGAVVEKVGRPGGSAAGSARSGRRRRGSACLRKLAKCQVLRNVVDGNIKAGSVEHIKDIECIL